MADDMQLMRAIAVVRDHLQSELISDSCRDHAMFGCVSCQALALDRQLALLAELLTTEPPEEPAEGAEGAAE